VISESAQNRERPPVAVNIQPAQAAHRLLPQRSTPISKKIADGIPNTIASNVVPVSGLVKPVVKIPMFTKNPAPVKNSTPNI
jgi:hypothetical protein